LIQSTISGTSIMKQQITFVAALSIACISSCEVHAQNAAYPPVLRDLPEAATLPGQGSFDVLGIRLGQKRGEALARITALKPSTPLENISQPIEVRDSRGNSVRFAYDRFLRARLKQSDGTEEVLTVNFTTRINGERVDRIERYVMYAAAAQGSVPALISDMNAKYGPASFERKPGTALWIDRVWYNKKFIKLDPTVNPLAAKKGTPASCINADGGGQYLFNVLQQNDWPGCSVHFKVEIQLGRSDSLAANAKFMMIDFARWAANVRDTDAWVTSEMTKSASGAGSRSKL
jgi:hypothetical protein